MEDAQIVELYWQRSEDAIAESGRKYGAMLTGIAYGVLQNRLDSEECVNDAYVRAWNCIPPDRPAFLGAFLGRITRRLAIDRWRIDRTQKHGYGAVVCELSDCIPSSHSVEQAVDGRLLTAAIDRWLNTLPAREQDLFIRRYWYGDGLNALAERFHSTPNKLAGRLFRLRQKLRFHLQKEELL
ncbi:MAG: RNA polymerase sigma factor [Acutalibacteraceae bacterium]|jgi:RNA polymerase sigma factor (sigma-70 family)